MEFKTTHDMVSFYIQPADLCKLFKTKINTFVSSKSSFIPAFCFALKVTFMFNVEDTFRKLGKTNERNLFFIHKHASDTFVHDTGKIIKVSFVSRRLFFTFH